MRISHLLSAASCTVIALAAVPAMAQDGPDGESASEDPGIIVTARRQSEQLQDVPASVAVITADALAKTGADNAEDFVALTESGLRRRVPQFEETLPNGVTYRVRDLLMDEDAQDRLDEARIRSTPALEVDGQIYAGDALTQEKVRDLLGL